MSRGKHNPPEMRGFKKRSGVWYLYEAPPPGSGLRWKAHRLSRDLEIAIAKAKKIRAHSTGYLEQLADELAADVAAGNEDSEDFAIDLAERLHTSGTLSLADAKMLLDKVRGRAVDLTKLAETDADVLSNKTLQTRRDALKRTGLRYAHEVGSRKKAVEVLDKLLASGLSRSTVSLTVKTLATLYQIGINQGLLESNPFARMNVKVPRTQKRALTVSEVRAAVDQLQTPFSDLFIVLVITGARVNEILGLREAEFDKTLGAITIGKSKTAAGVRVVPLPKVALAAMKALLQKPVSYEVAHTAISNVYKDLKIQNADVHSLRRTCSQFLLECGIPEHISASIVGHRHKSMTYGLYATAGPSLEQRRDALESIAKYAFG